MARRDARKYLGQGIKHPVVITSKGGVALENDISLVRQSIRRLLNKQKGTRFFNRDLGSWNRLLMFEPNDLIAQSLLQTTITEAIETWEKRVERVNLDFELRVDEPEVIYCRIEYRIKSSNEVDSFIYPFYRELKY